MRIRMKFHSFRVNIKIYIYIIFYPLIVHISKKTKFIRLKFRYVLILAYNFQFI